jgi:hypothetical protein
MLEVGGWRQSRKVEVKAKVEQGAGSERGQVLSAEC